MCGICGIIDYKRSISFEEVQKMLKPMSHRGPDDNGCEVYSQENCMVGLGHVRLSIIDLSKLGHQPMVYDNLTIVFNGEIYNYKEIRQELLSQGHFFKSNSDTEVILHSFKEWGMQCVHKFIGMFAFAIYDSSDGKVYLCRDRAGVKPLYYYQDGTRFAFSSELKGILSIEGIDTTIDEESLAYFIQLGYIPLDKCILANANKLEAGHWLIFDTSTSDTCKKKYWDIDDFYNMPKITIPYGDAKEELKSILKSAFGYRMISDVSVGVFLSGGIDSSLVASILTKELGHSLKTFTIGFRQGPNEAPDAEIIAKYLGTNHQSYYCTTQDVQDIIPGLPYFFDEPCADISAIPTTLVSKITGRDVKVALSADGGDEIFAGYYSYEYLSKCMPKFRMLHRIRKMVDIPYYAILPLVPQKRTAYRWIMDTIQGYCRSNDSSVKGLLSNTARWDRRQYRKVRGLNYNCEKTFDYISVPSDSVEYAMSYDFKINMRELLCTKVDRASMSVSLEVREPMLDHRIAEFGARLPIEFKYCDGVKKRILKDIIYDYLPKPVIDKPKKGFNISLDSWLRSDLKGYVYDNLTVSGLSETGFNAKQVRKMLDNYMKGYHYGYAYRGYSNLIWRFLQYQLWYNMWIKK